ncbi:MAG: pilus assembly protein PilM [Peptococcaceae bacterium]|jgi:cell division protein FtsA|nr:pilus assembly protein PilM [Peptococcaceae bacterium]
MEKTTRATRPGRPPGKSSKPKGRPRKTPVKESRKGTGALPGGQGDEPVFALDIGTRSVIGLVGKMEGDMLRIEAVAAEEYQSRAVVDGQIEDIQETAKIAKKVKQRLEDQVGRSFTQVHIAAAGRVLRTGEGTTEAETPANQVIDAAMMAKMEFTAIQRVHERLVDQEEDQEDSFLCVGHSVVYYRLDDYDFSTLVGHKGSKASVKVIATFLPKEVVESLNSTMARIGLTVAGLTLEPIAAINAVIPQDIRKLNLALVDIGAGTSDIALCERGSVSAYTMATVAGDEITEAIMEACLADFNTAENLKRRMGEKDILSYTNILGYTVEIEGEELYRQVKPAIDRLVNVICEKITAVNAKPPAALFLVGGGSQIPGLASMAAKALGMEESRVVVGGSANMKKQAVSDQEIFGPEYATPLGIAITAVQRDKDDAFTIMVNGEKVPMPGVWEMTVLDALQLAGFKYSQIMGRAGRTLIYEMDGERRSLRGGLPGASSITRNGRDCALGDMVTPGDQLLFEPAHPGKDAILTVGEAAGAQKQIRVRVNGILYTAGEIATVNGKPAEPTQVLRSMDAIRHKTVHTVDDLRRDLEINLGVYKIYINDREEPGSRLLSNDDVVETRVKDEYAGSAGKGKGEPLPAKVPDIQPGKGVHLRLNGEIVDLPPKADGMPYCFFDMFAYVDIDAKNPRGDLIQTVNGKEASYMLELADGDDVVIRWTD